MAGSFQLLPQVRFVIFVDPRVPRRIEAEQSLCAGRWLTKEFRDARIKLWRLAKAPPNGLQCGISAKDSSGDAGSPERIGVDLELGLAEIPEGVPAATLRAGLKQFRSIQPAQQVADWVAHGQLVEIIGVQPSPPQHARIRVGKDRQNAKKRLLCSPVSRNVEPEAFVGDQKRLHGPIVPVGLMPHAAPVLKLNQRLRSRRTIASGSQLLPADVG